MILVLLEGLVAVPRLVAAPVTGPARVLILDETVIGGATSLEAFAAQTALPGCAVDVVSAANWGAIPGTGLGGPTGYGFDSYRAIIWGDPYCNNFSTGYLAAMSAINANKLTWTPAAAGNVIIMGVDNALHAVGIAGASNTVMRGVAFAVNDPTKTGLYYAMSCYYDGVTTPVLVPHLTGFGTFMTKGYGTCFNDAHIVATHPVFTAPPPLTDADLSNWSCSTHEGFDVWPGNFVVLAIALTNGTFTATDGSNGIPYIVVRGEGVHVISPITLDPPTVTNLVGTTHTVCATIATNISPRVGVSVTFTISSGPNAVTNYTTTTDANGVACFTYVGLGGVGTDYITASYTATGSTGGDIKYTSGTVSKIWAGTCLALGCEDLECLPDATWSYQFCVTNLTSAALTSLSFQSMTPGVTFTPASTNLSPVLNPGQSTTLALGITSTNGAVSFCILITAHPEGGGTPPCTIPRCLTLPTCCNRVISNQLVYASSSGIVSTYNYQITIQNISASPVKYVGFAADQSCVTFSPALLDLTLPTYGGPSLLLPSQIRTLNLLVQKTAPCPGSNTIYMSTFTTNLVACCSTKLKLPNAKCVYLVSPFSGAVVLTNTVVALRAIPNPLGPCAFIKVMYYADSTYLGQVATAPYELDYVPGVPGIYQLTAVAQLEGSAGGSGEVETSDPVELIVIPPDTDPNHNGGGIGHLSAGISGNTVTIGVATFPGQHYSMEYRTNLTKGGWQSLESFVGDGTFKTVTDSITNDSSRFYRAVSGP